MGHLRGPARAPGIPAVFPPGFFLLIQTLVEVLNIFLGKNGGRVEPIDWLKMLEAVREMFGVQEYMRSRGQCVVLLRSLKILQKKQLF